MIGTTLSHYKILEELGRGGMGVVYKAEDTKLGRMVALKFLSSHLTEDATAKERFLREARAAAILRHDSICAIHDIGEEEDGTMYIVMPHYEGMTLKDRIAQGPIAPDLAVSIALQIAAGLGAAHAQGLTHRDIKPGNILLTEGDRVKVLDFGLAKLAGDVDLTLSSSTVGTMAYMSPEQVQNAKVDARSDLWSLGVVLYEMVTGEKPFFGTYEAAVVYGIVNQKLEMDHPAIPDSLKPVLEMVLDKEPANRFASALEFSEALGGAPVAISKEKPAAPPQQSPDSKSSILKWVAVGVSAIVLIALGILMIPGSENESAVPVRSVSNTSGLPTVGVMYIENNTPRDRLGFVLRDMLARNLGQVDSIQVISNQRLKDILRQELGDEAESISASSATAVARQAGVQTMILGSVVQLGSEFILEAELTDVETGNIIDAVSAVAASESDIMAAMNRLTDGILLGSGKMAVGENGLYRIEDVSTSNLTAYELFEKGMDEMAHWRFAEATQSFMDAIDIDSTFVAPYIGAMNSSSVFSVRPVEDLSFPRNLVERATRQLAHATESEKDKIAQIKKALTLSGEDLSPDTRRLAAEYPDDKWFQFHAVFNVSGKEKYDYYNRLFELDPSFAVGYNMLAYHQLADNRMDEAVSTIRRYLALQPDVVNTMDSAWEVMTGAGRTEDALSVLDRALEDHPDWPGVKWRKAYTKILAGDTTGVNRLLEEFAATTSLPARMEAWRKSHIALAQGKWEEARRLSATYLRESRRGRSDEGLLFDLRNHGAVLHATQHHAEAEQILEEAVEISSQVYGADFNPFPVLAAYENGLGYANVGNLSLLEKSIAALEQAVKAPGLDARHSFYLHLLQAHANLLRGNVDGARKNLEGIGFSYMIRSHYSKLMAHVQAAGGEMDDAQLFLDHVKNDIAFRGFEIGAYSSFFIDHATVSYERARLHDEFGDRTEAIRLYEEALRHYESLGADFRYVDMTRERLAALQSGS